MTHWCLSLFCKKQGIFDWHCFYESKQKMFLRWNFSLGVNMQLWHLFSFLHMQVTIQSMDEKLGRTVTRVVLPRVVMRARYHYGVSNYQKHVGFLPENDKHLREKKGLLEWVFMFCKVHWWLICYAQAFSENFTGLELEDGGGRGTSGIFLFQIQGQWTNMLCIVSNCHGTKIFNRTHL